MISTHILDTMAGDPAANVTVKLEMKHGDEWAVVSESRTNDDGRIEYFEKVLENICFLFYQVVL